LASYSSISIDRLGPGIGTQRAPIVVDVRSDDEFQREPYLIPGSIRRNPGQTEKWATALTDRAVVVVCSNGGPTSQGVGASLRSQGICAQTLDGGFEAWRSGATS
jgi:rhodanese-related sulfurtransferase